MMELWKSVAGMLEVELTSAAPEMAISTICDKNIPMFHTAHINDLTLRFQIYRKDYHQLMRLCQKRGETLKVCKRKGIHWMMESLFRRPVLLIGMLFFLWMAMYLPSRILFVEVEGNSLVPAKRILDAAEECGICFGASRREVRSEKIKNALLSMIPELQWAGVNTSGCVATISVRERLDPETEGMDNSVCSIVASRDGVVSSYTVTRGNGLCTVGQAVKEGEVLISGYTDCGLCIQATRAEGEIYAQTNRNLTAVTPLEYTVRTQAKGSAKKYSLIIGKKRINLWKDSGIWDGSCGRMYQEYWITLPGGFQLPVAFVIEEFTAYETEAAQISETSCVNLLALFADSYLLEHMVAGKIISKEETVSAEEGICRMDGKYVCSEMIGRVQREQIGE